MSALLLLRRYRRPAGDTANDLTVGGLQLLVGGLPIPLF